MNIAEYVETEFSDFTEKEFSEVDSLVLSQLSYFSFKGVVPGMERRARAVRMKDIYKLECLPEMIKMVRFPKENMRLIAALAGSPRFRDIRIRYYVNEVDDEMEKQFSAMCFILDKRTAYIAFRGTDATFTGWKEDFNMAFMDEVPAQTRAVKYINALAPKLRKRAIIVGGHSKGGNLAVYAAAKCKQTVQKRIKAAYSHDGPGFRPRLLESAQYKNIKEKVSKTVPQSSIIGMLLEHQEEFTVVKSNRSGIMQHDPYSWEIVDASFVTLGEMTKSAKIIDRALSGWLAGLSDADRERFVDTLFQIIKESGAATVYDLESIKLKSVMKITGRLDPDTRKFLNDVITNLVVLSLKA